MKIAIYAISKNESKFVEKFYESCKDADYIVVADTGSTDDTKAKLKAIGPNVIVGDIVINPWRFDYARNASLELVPKDTDVFVCLDLDEIMKPGWRQKLETACIPGKTRFRYKYTWNWKPDGTPDVQYNGDKIHCKGYHWHHPVHEILRWDGNGPEEFGWSDLEIEHYADNSKPRSHYLGLLELAVREDPDDDRNAHYLGREYYFVGRHLDAINELKRHLSLPKAQWDAERAASMRYMSDCYNTLKDQKQRISWALRAVAEAPAHREPWTTLAQAYYDAKDYLGGYYAAKHALDIKDRQNSYLTKGDAWGALPYDLAGTCAYYVGLHLEAYELTLRAYRINPNDVRVQGNVKFMEEYIRDNLGQNANDVIEHTKKVISLE